MPSLSEKQSIILDFVRRNGNITTKKANELLAKYYYHNSQHYVSEILTRLVKSNKLIRVSIGYYELGKGIRTEYIIDNQPSLF